MHLMRDMFVFLPAFTIFDRLQQIQIPRL